jgi:hypothetical protein
VNQQSERIQILNADFSGRLESFYSILGVHLPCRGVAGAHGQGLMLRQFCRWDFDNNLQACGL